MSMKERKGLLLSVGTPSILLVLLVFVLSVFALLSIRASANEQKLADKTAKSVEEYYAADAKAEYALGYIDSVLESAKISDLKMELLNMKNSNEDNLKGLKDLKVTMKSSGDFQAKKMREVVAEVSFAFPVKEKETLCVALQLLADRTYKITEWKVSMEELGEYDSNYDVELWDGQVDVEE